MLADQFVTAEQKLQQRNARRSGARKDRDDFIAAQFPQLDFVFSSMVSQVVGMHPKLSVLKLNAVDTFTNHEFASLQKTIITIASTLYGTTEKVIFTPFLESVEKDQFGIIKITTDGLTIPKAPEFILTLLRQGILMRGAVSAYLATRRGTNFETLSNSLLETFLAALLIRTRS